MIEVRKGKWPKNSGISISGKTVGIVGYGDIGKNTALTSKALGLNIIVYDPGEISISDKKISHCQWPESIENCDFLIFTCALNSKNRHMFNANIIEKCNNL